MRVQAVVVGVVVVEAEDVVEDEGEAEDEGEDVAVAVGVAG